jgi:hypothetical protein
VGTTEEAVQDDDDDDDDDDEGVLGRSAQLSDLPSLFGLLSPSHSQFRHGMHFSLSLSLLLEALTNARRCLAACPGSPLLLPPCREEFI